MVNVLKRGECDERTCIFTLEVVKFGRKIANADSENDQQSLGGYTICILFPARVTQNESIHAAHSAHAYEADGGLVVGVSVGGDMGMWDRQSHEEQGESCATHR